MKRPPAAFLLAIFLGLTPMLAADTVADEPGKTTTGTGGGFAVSGETRENFKRREPKIIKLTALTPDRAWTNAEGREIMAALIAYDPPEPEPGVELAEELPPIVIQQGKIRLLRNDKVFEIALDSLSIKDQTYIEELVFAIQEAEERKAEAAASAKAKAEAQPEKEQSK